MTDTLSTNDGALPEADVAGAEIMARADAISAFNEATQGVTRRFLTPEHRAAADMIMGWMRDAGMDAVGLDDAGNVIGRYEGETPGLPALITGSHQDTVSEGGKYDGMLGVLTPIACVAALSENGERLAFAIEVVAFGDEEGLRFQTSLFGSEALAGTLAPSELERTDGEGVSVAQALRDFGLDPEAVAGLARKPVDVLEINGDISDRRAELSEDLLWNLIPEAGHLRDQVGRIDVANGARTSHPLALTQLLVGYHAVKAAMGIRAY